MSRNIQVGLGIAAMIAIVATESGGVLLITVAALVAVAVVEGRRLPLSLRVFATGMTFFFGYQMCLVGRTMAPGLTSYTFQMAITMFCLFASVPTIAMLRIWRHPFRILLVTSALPISLAAACIVATYEEREFVRQHQSGVGTTARWTVSNHWLAYDAQSHRLSGSD